MGAHRPGAGAALRVQPLSEALHAEKLYGRRRGHTLRSRQQALLQLALPRLRVDPGAPWAAFGERERWLEVGFGGGEHARALAQAHPEIGLVACEVFENGICSMLSQLVPEGEEASSAPPPNLRLWDADARALIRSLADESCDRLFLLFPDPWPKARHSRRRFVGPAMLAEAARILRPGAEWRIASDDPTYQAWVAALLAAQSAFAADAPAAARPPGWPPTRYEAKAVRAGRQPLYWTLRRLEGGHAASGAAACVGVMGGGAA